MKLLDAVHPVFRCHWTSCIKKVLRFCGFPLVVFSTTTIETSYAEWIENWSNVVEERVF